MFQVIQDYIMEGEELMQDPNHWLRFSQRQFEEVEKAYWEESLIGVECPSSRGGFEVIARQEAKLNRTRKAGKERFLRKEANGQIYSGIQRFTTFGSFLSGAV
jgi:hypothetical protein